MKSDAEVIDFLRGKENDWSQDEGLALFLLLEKIAPGWQKRVLGPAMTSPFELLEKAIKTPSRERKRKAINQRT